MDTYTINITNNKLTVSLSSNDKEFILREIDKLRNEVYPEVEKPEQVLVLKKSKAKNKKNEAAKDTKQLIKESVEASQVREETKQEAQSSDFANVLSKKLKKTVQNVVEKKNSELQNAYRQMQAIINDKNLTTDFDYIIVAAHCLYHFENLNRFTQKQINSKVYPFLMRDIDTDTFDGAINEGYIKILPDFTGVSDIIEYEITQKAEEYFLNELQ